MTTDVDNCNNALLKIGVPRIISSLTQDAVEARACNTVYSNTRDCLLRMAPWDCALKTLNLAYITSVPGTPENTSPATNLWQPGQPRPPWAYEYQYPVDCLRACWIIPAIQSGFAGGIPITTAVTGRASTTWLGGPIPFKIGTDQFFGVSNVSSIAIGGTGHAVGDIITLPIGPITSPPIGAPAQLLVLSVSGAGAILSASPITSILGSALPVSGSYFAQQTSPIAQASTSGVGIGASFNLNFTGPGKLNQRVILTNQEYATLVYVQQVTDPNVWDPLLQEAFQCSLAGEIALILKGDKDLANTCVAKANNAIVEARKADGNEGLTVNNITPDWIRIRGIDFSDEMTGSYSGFDWGGLLPGWG